MRVKDQRIKSNRDKLCFFIAREKCITNKLWIMKGRGPKLQPRSRVARRWVRGQVPSDVRTNTDVAVPAKKQSDMHAMIMHGMIIIIIL